MSATSIRSAPAVSRASHASPRRQGSIDQTQPREIAVAPPESPNRIGFRHVTGPSHAPPSTPHTSRWITPLATSTRPIAASGQAR